MVATLVASDEKCRGSWHRTAELVEQAQAGDREAFGHLIEQFQRTVYAIGLRRLGNASDASEFTQDVFLHVMKRIAQIREPERFAGWLRQLAHRMAINWATRRVPPGTVEDEILEGFGAKREDPLDDLIKKERAAHLWQALEGLKKLDRETLVDFYIQGQSLLEISVRLEVPLGTVKRRLHTARKRLKEALDAESPDADPWSGNYEGEEEEEVLPWAVCPMS